MKDYAASFLARCFYFSVDFDFAYDCFGCDSDPFFFFPPTLTFVYLVDLLSVTSYDQQIVKLSETVQASEIFSVPQTETFSFPEILTFLP